jgi:hypothetical protein
MCFTSKVFLFLLTAPVPKSFQTLLYFNLFYAHLAGKVSHRISIEDDRSRFFVA